MKSITTTDLLVDLMEDELVPSHKRDMRLYVQNSPSGMKELQHLQMTKTLVKKVEGKVPNLTDEAFDRMHSQIMKAVQNTKQETPPPPALSRRRDFRSLALGVVAACVVLVSSAVLWNVLSPRVSLQQVGSNPEAKSSDMLLAISVEVPEAFADSLLSDRNEIDFYLDAAAQKVGRLKNDVDVNEFYDEFVE
jgi:hypothetical protein